ncbi:hypothetical protein [Mesobacillus zeae]|uniref:hypothetical protein n=1 Tax=Mesobacillus zeae TaxID=1917180 RepID=UPI0015E78331|nr:hypothetical protein [Mesobacillus zeae]
MPALIVAKHAELSPCTREINQPPEYINQTAPVAGFSLTLRGQEQRMPALSAVEHS